jgi:hypothetical protein
VLRLGVTRSRGTVCIGGGSGGLGSGEVMRRLPPVGPLLAAAHTHSTHCCFSKHEAGSYALCFR